jgi:hypothetical protein
VLASGAVALDVIGVDEAEEVTLGCVLAAPGVGSGLSYHEPSGARLLLTSGALPV